MAVQAGDRHDANWTLRVRNGLPGSALPPGEALAEALVARLAALGLRIVIGESCTAGALASLLSRPAGAASALFGGFVVYMPEAKVALLGVPERRIERWSAVSGPVARAMASGLLQRSPADIALAVTGVTGDCPDERGNPRGRVFIAALARDGRGILCHCEFGAFPPPVLLDATERTALAVAGDLLERG